MGFIKDIYHHGEGQLIMRNLNRIYVGNFESGLPDGYGNLYGLTMCDYEKWEPEILE